MKKIVKNEINGLTILILSVIILFLIDISSKYYFSNKQLFLDKFIHINSAINTGSAFSMFSNVNYYSFIIGILGLIFVLSLIYFKYYLNEFNTKYLNLIFILMIAGVLGNTYDRFLFGFTRDFIGFGNFFIFNIADVYLTLSVIIFFLYELKLFKKNEK